MSVTTEGWQQSSGESAETRSADEPPYGPAARLFGPRGRHRRPRPRKVLLAAGGLALAAGALSLVRLVPDSALDGPGTAEAEAEPHPDPDAGTNGSADTAATVPAALPAPKVSPSATTVMGGAGSTPTAGTLHVPTTGANANAAAASTMLPLFPAPGTTSGAPDAPRTNDTEAPAPARTTTAPQPAPKPASPTADPAQPDQSGQPTRPDDGDVCVPVIGLCVDSLTTGD